MRNILTIGSAAVLAAAAPMETAGRRPRLWSAVPDISPPTEVELTFALSLSNGEKLTETLLRVSTPSSSDYGKLLTLEEVNSLTEPSSRSIETVETFLRANGAQEIGYSSGFLRATFPIKVAEQMLEAKYSTFRHVHTGELATRCDAYSLPDDVARHVDFVAPTVNFPQPMQVRSVQGTTQDSYQNTPDSLRELYGVDDALGGKSNARQGVTAFLHQYYTESDLQQFYKEYFPELSGVPIAEVIGPNSDTAGVEASLDVEYMTTLGAGVPTEFWSFPGRQPDAPANEPFLDFLYLLGNTTNPPLVFSTSYGEDETSVTMDYAERMNQEFQKNSLRGISFLFASGDSGVGSMSGQCTEFMPMYPADSPYVTAVGATTEVNPEVGAGLSSGGFSNR